MSPKRDCGSKRVNDVPGTGVVSLLCHGFVTAELLYLSKIEELARTLVVVLWTSAGRINGQMCRTHIVHGRHIISDGLRGLQFRVSNLEQQQCTVVANVCDLSAHDELTSIFRGSPFSCFLGFFLLHILAQQKRTAHRTALQQHTAEAATQLCSNSAYILVAPPYNPNLEPKYNPPLGGTQT